MRPALASTALVRLLEMGSSKYPPATHLFETSGLGVAVLDKHYCFRVINNALAKMHGISVEAHKGKTIHQVLGDIAEIVAPALDQVLKSRHPVMGIELSGKLPNRSKTGRWVKNFIPLADDSGRVTEVGVLVVEITTNARSRLTLPYLPDDGHWMGGIVAAKPQLGTKAKPGGLSARGLQIVRLLAEGKSNKEVAYILGISIKTVETHRARIMAKLRLHSVVGLVHYAFRHGLVRPQL
jgi:DNA-binding CsgD family transcriptional regulator